MAIQGLSTFTHSPLNESTGTYGAAAKTGGAIEAKLSVNYNDATIYSDDRLKKKNTSFKDGKVTLTVDYANKVILSPLIGRTTTPISFTSTAGKTVTSTKHISKTNDKPIPVGFGYIIKDLDVDANKDVYTVKFFYKIEFAPYTQDAKTQEGAITYTYTTLEGTIFELPNGNWCEEEDFDDLETAIEYLYSLYAATCKTPVASIEGGYYTAAQSVTLIAGAGEVIYYTIDGLTPTKSSTLYSTAISIADDTMLRAIATKTGSSDSAIAEYEYIITA